MKHRSLTAVIGSVAVMVFGIAYVAADGTTVTKVVVAGDRGHDGERADAV